MIELLAPAGGEESFYAAVNNGANAVYLGLDLFSARKNAGNFTLEKLKEVSAYARLLGVKVYCALNTLIKDSELENFERCAIAAVEAGADALILQDMFLGGRLKEKYPFLNLHLSTQAGVCNVFGAKAAAEHGFSRVILARETPLGEIKKISSTIECEAFVQGALCTSFSGHCYMSSFIGGNSGNRGLCKQPCRKKYTYYGSNFKEKEGYSLSLSDLMLGADVAELIAAGVTSFKIEGRMRRPEYVAASCAYYSAALNGREGDAEALKRTYNRGDYTKGFVFGQAQNLISAKVQNHKGSFIGRVESVAGRRIFVRSRYKPIKGDGFKIISDGGECGGFSIAGDCCAAGGFYADVSGRAMPGDEVYVTTDARLNGELLSAKKTVPVSLDFILGEKCRLVMFARGTSVESEAEAQPAKSRPLAKADVEEQILKFSGEPFAAENVKIEIKGSYFMPKSAINAMRRECVEKFKAVLSERKVGKIKYRAALEPVNADAPDNMTFQPVFGLASDIAFIDNVNGFTSDIAAINNVNTSTPDIPTPNLANATVLGKDRSLAVISDRFDFCLDGVTEAIFTPSDYSSAEETERFFAETENFRGERFLYLPPFFTERDAMTVYPFINRYDGIYCDGVYGVEFAGRVKKELFAGIEFNIFNRVDAEELAKSGIYKFCLSKELSDKEASAISGGYLFTCGAIKVMSLEYCPFGKKCAQCRREDNFFMRDYAGREFRVRRYKLGGCRFEIYNPDYLYFGGDAKKRIVDLNTLDGALRGRVLKNINDREELKKILKNLTSGNLIRGVE